MRLNACSTICSSSRIVLPATMTGRPRRHPEIAQDAVLAAAFDRVAPGTSIESNFRLPVTTTRPGSAPMSIRRRADSSLCMQNLSMSASTFLKNEPHELVARIRARRNPAVDHDRGHAHPLALAEEIRPDLGLHHHEQPRLTSRSVRRTMNDKSNGK